MAIIARFLLLHNAPNTLCLIDNAQWRLTLMVWLRLPAATPAQLLCCVVLCCVRCCRHPYDTVLAQAKIAAANSATAVLPVAEK